MKKYFREQSAITLVEMVIMITIIGILTMIASARYLDFSHAAKRAKCQLNQQHLITAQRLYWVDASVHEGKGRYAADIDMLTPYLKTGQIPVCPEEGTYLIILDLDIQCSLADHAI